MESVDRSEVIYEFGRFVLDPRERLLLFDGRPVHLRAKEFETLLLFLENSGRAISKEEMISALWPDSFVEESNLAKQICRLRKVFDGDGSAFIETLPKHGYRFSAAVSRTFRPAEETSVGEQTGGRFMPDLENQVEGPHPPSSLRSPNRHHYRHIYTLAALIIFVGAAVILAWRWRTQSDTVTPEKSGSVFLTDGSHDDSGARLTSTGKIYFSRRPSNERIESWVMSIDGSDVRRANSEIRDLLHGVWSPDGKKVVFTKEGDKTVYLADSTGANEVALPIPGGNMDWSPDGSQFVHQARVAHDKTEIFLYTLATGENIRLTDVPAADPSFSYDGKMIAFTGWRDGNPEIYVMNVDGSNVRRMTDHPAFDQYPVFTPDGTAIAFQSNREDERIEIYLQDLNVAAPPQRITNSNTYTGLSTKGWSPDGTRLLLYTNQNGKNRIFWADVEPSQPKVVLRDASADINFSLPLPDGKRVLSQVRLADASLAIRLTDLESGRTETIYRTTSNYPPGFSLAPRLSPDAARISFNDRVNGNSEIFVINADGSDLRNLSNDPLADTNPIIIPDGREIIFTRDFYGKSRLFRMDIDGGRQRNLTEFEGYELNGGLSPDGSMLAFSADRLSPNSRGLDIYLLNVNDPGNEVRLTARDLNDVTPAFSPDGNRIVFASSSDGNWEIYLINRDGSGLRRLTRNVADDTSPQWSPDGQRILFTSKRSGRSALYEIRP